MNMSPYFYAIVAYFVLMLLAKVAYTYMSFKKEEKAIKPNWNFNLVQLRQALMSVWF